MTIGKVLHVVGSRTILNCVAIFLLPCSQREEFNPKACSLPNMLECPGLSEEAVESCQSSRREQRRPKGGGEKVWGSGRLGGSGKWRRSFTPALELPRLRLPKFTRVNEKGEAQGGV